MRTAPTRRTIDSSLGKMPTTSARRLTSLLRRSSGVVGCSLVRGCAGKACSASSISVASLGQRNALGDGTEKVAVAALLQQLGQWQSVLGHRGVLGRVEVSNPTLTANRGDHLRPTCAGSGDPPPNAPEITPRPRTLPLHRLAARSSAPLKLTQRGLFPHG